MKRRVWIGVGVAAVALLIVASAFSGGGAEIDVVSPTRGEIRESFREPGMTRLENDWTIAAQVSGRIGRIQFEPGDRVTQGQVLAEYDLEPFDQAVAEAEATLRELEASVAVLDDDAIEKTSISEAERSADSLAESVRSAEARVKSAERRVEHAARDLGRVRELFDAGTLARSVFDDAQFEFDTAELTLRQAKADLAAARANLASTELSPTRLRQQLDKEKLARREILARFEQAQARLQRLRHDRDLAKLVSPIDGVVLERYDRGEKPVAAGTPLLKIGNPAEIEAVVDVLSQDALRLIPGGAVELESAVDGLKIAGRVKRVEPQGFTKFSSLGVEQQRVNVVVEIDDPPPTLGVGFRLYGRFFTGEKSDALIVPRFAVLQAPDASYYVFVVEGGRLAKRTVEIGLRSDLEVEIVSGLSEKDVVVRTPDSTLEEGLAVRPREE